MSSLTDIPSSYLWQYLYAEYGNRKLELEFTKALITFYSNSEPNYIPFYEFEIIQKKSNINSKVLGQPLIDFLCFQTEILELHFRLIDSDDNHHEIDFDLMQEIISGQDHTFGNVNYSSKAASERIFTYFVPTENFQRLKMAQS